MTVDFGAVYNYTFESLRAFWGVVDYEKLPPKMESYGAEDQKRIREKMADALKELQSG